MYLANQIADISNRKNARRRGRLPAATPLHELGCMEKQGSVWKISPVLCGSKLCFVRVSFLWVWT